MSSTNKIAAASSASGGTATKSKTPARNSVGIREVVSAMLYTADGQLLLQQRDDKPSIPYPNTWTLFGGAVEPNEPPFRAIVRELDEELELQTPLTLWFRFPCPVRSIPGKLVCMHYCYAGPLSVPLETLVLHEGQRFALFSPDAAMALPLAFDQQDVVRWFVKYGLMNA